MPKISLDVLVIGAGLSTHIVALGLSRAGHKVTIVADHTTELEQKGKLPGLLGLSPPNMTRILKSWGLGPELERTSDQLGSLRMRDGHNGELVSEMGLDDHEFIENTGAGFYSFQNRTIVSIIRRLTDTDPAINKISGTILKICPSPYNVAISFSDRGQIAGDFIICAEDHDRYGHIFDHLVPPENETMPLSIIPPPGPKRVITFILPIGIVRASEDDDLVSLTYPDDESQWLIWHGEGFLFNVMVSDGDQNMIVTLVLDYNQVPSTPEKIWRIIPFDFCNIDTSKFEPRIVKLLNLVDYVYCKVFVTKPKPESLACANSRTILAGEAAHPVQPGLNTQHLALTFEDAETLRRLFSHIERRDQIPNFISMYEDIRQPHSDYISDYQQNIHNSLTIPRGTNRNRLNATLRHCMLLGADWDHMEDPSFEDIWGTEFRTYLFNVNDNVDDWLLKWKNLLAKRLEPPPSYILPESDGSGQSTQASTSATGPSTTPDVEESGLPLFSSLNLD